MKKSDVKELIELLREIQKKRYYEPNSDYYEYCGDCGNSPYNKPRHLENCLVPKISKILNKHKDA